MRDSNLRDKPTVISPTDRLKGWAPFLLLSCLLPLLPVTAADSPDKPASKESKPDPALLTLDRIYRNSDLGSKGYSARWQDAGHSYYQFKSSAHGGGTRDIVEVDAETGDTQVVVPGNLFIPDDESRPLSVDGYTFSADRSRLLIYTNTRRVWRTHSRGDYWVLDLTSRTLRKLAQQAAPSTTQFAKFSPDGSRVAYVVDGNIYVEDLLGGDVQCLTKRKSKHIINGTFDWVYEEELSLRDGFRWSPDGQRIAFWQLDTSPVRTFRMLNNTDSLYPELIEFAHPKAGERNSLVKMGVVDVATQQTQWYQPPAEHYLARIQWLQDSHSLVIQQFNRLQNRNDVLVFDHRNPPATRAILTETDPAWVDVHDHMQWFDADRKFTWLSERDGWRHLYVVDADTGTTKLLTPGEFDVISVSKVDLQNRRVYFVASPDNATQRYLFSVNLDGSAMQRVTPDGFEGTHGYRISGDGNYAVYSRSSANSPPETSMIRLPSHETVRQLEDNAGLRKKLAKLRRADIQFLRIKAGDVTMDAKLIPPPQIKRGKRYPVLVYVYGEPAGTTVVNRWGGSSDLWHTMLAQQGIAVLSIDNRGTRVPKGRAWRKSIYRQVGIIAPQDQANALQEVLKQHEYLDPERVGIWGWSGGGSMSLNAIFKFPKLYKAAVSVAPVPNQRYYDTIYQERYMGLPHDNIVGYRDGSAINYAHQLQGELLLIHGTGDDNCHYQTMEMLINELIYHNKQFQMLAYPNRTHSVREGRNTTLHLRTLMTKFWQRHLLQ